MRIWSRLSCRSRCAARALLLWVLVLACGSPALAAEIRFEEASAALGIDFRHHHGGSGEYYMCETMGSGVAIFDYDGDGDQDLFFVDSGELPGYVGETPRSRLFRNDGERFTDVTDRSGIEVTGYGQGVTAGDVDGDGDLDLYVSAFGPNQLFRNRGDGTFEDVTEVAGVGNSLFGSSTALADTDRDGDLDLYVTNYVDFTLDHNIWCGKRERGIQAYCHPDAYPGQPDVFYRNRGDGTFEDATSEAGLSMARGKGLGVTFADFDDDGWTDLYVSNDMTANLLFRNLKDGTFEEMGLMAGAAFNARGNPEAGMGVDVGDLDGDALPELMTTHIDEQSNSLYGYVGSWLFIDKRFTARMAEASFHRVGFGVGFADLDQDRDLDIVVANGHIIDNIELFKQTTTFRQPNEVFENLGEGRFKLAGESGLGSIVRSSRGLSLGDLDGDGDLDLAINNSNDQAEVWRNLTSGGGGWLQVALRRASGDRFAIGSRVTVEAGGRSQWREVRSGTSYESQSSLVLHFGLGDAERVDRLTARWPDGRVQVVEGVPAGHRVLLFDADSR